MRSNAYALPTLPGFAGPKTYAIATTRDALGDPVECTSRKKLRLSSRFSSHKSCNVRPAASP